MGACAIQAASGTLRRIATSRTNARRPTRRSPDRRLSDLLDAIYDDPLDDGPRHVYADALQEAGDPRGEFIALQLSWTQLREALAQHGATEIAVVAPGGRSDVLHQLSGGGDLPSP